MKRWSVRLGCALSMSFVFAGVLVAFGRQVPALEPAVFTPHEVLQLRLQAPFNSLFSGAKDDSKRAIAGVLSYTEPGTGKEVVLGPVEISVRGHSSRRETECSFPKLRLKLVAGPGTAASIFRDDPIVKVGTHCGEMPDGQLMPKYGRWANQKAAHREALVYRLLEAIGVRTLRVRPARVTYVYTDAHPGDVPDQARPITRDAFLLEDDTAAMRRMGATGRLEPPGADEADSTQGAPVGLFDDATARFRPQDSAQVAFAEAMIGNFDWAIKFTPRDSYRSAARGLWNVLAPVGPEGAFPVPYDFDLSGMVTGSHTWFDSVFEDDFLPGRSRTSVEVFAQVQRARSLFPRALLDATRERFLAARARAYETARTMPVDEQGRRFVLDHLDAFYAAIERDDAFYVPVVAKTGIRLFSDAAATTELCGGETVPVGTPVSRRDQQAGDGRTQVPLIGGGQAPLVPARLLDVMWRFGVSSKSRCDAIRRTIVWLDSSAIDRAYSADGR